MGTSQSLKPKHNTPQWQQMKVKINNLIDPEHLTSETAKKEYLSAFFRAVGNGQTAGSGTFGHSGRKVISSFLSFAANANHYGVRAAYEDLEFAAQIKWEDVSVEDFANVLLASCSDGNSHLDDEAAKGALSRLLKGLLNDVESVDDIDDIYKQQTSDTTNSWIAKYFAYYIIEYSEELFSAHIYEKGGDRLQISKEIYDYIERSIQTSDVLDIPLANVNWNSTQGQDIIKEYQRRIIEIWE